MSVFNLLELVFFVPMLISSVGYAFIGLIVIPIKTLIVGVNEHRLHEDFWKGIGIGLLCLFLAFLSYGIIESILK